MRTLLYDIYEQVNRINPESIPAGDLNKPVTFGTSNEIIGRRIALFYDGDAIKAKDAEGKSNYPASDEEKARAHELINKIDDYWAQFGVGGGGSIPETENSFMCRLTFPLRPNGTSESRS
jgi:hypothetical protein